MSTCIEFCQPHHLKKPTPSSPLAQFVSENDSLTREEKFRHITNWIYPFNIESFKFEVPFSFQTLQRHNLSVDKFWVGALQILCLRVYLNPKNHNPLTSHSLGFPSKLSKKKTFFTRQEFCFEITKLPIEINAWKIFPAYRFSLDMIYTIWWKVTPPVIK